MVGIWSYPELEEFRTFLLEGLELAKETAVDNVEDEAVQQGIELASVSRLLAVDEWGDGDAVEGGTTLNILVFFEIEGVENEDTLDIFDQVGRTITQTFIALVQNGEIAPPPSADSFFPAYQLEPVPASRFPENVTRQLGDRVGSTVFDITGRFAIEWQPRENLNLPQPPGENPVERVVEALPRIPLEQLQQRALSPPDDEEDEDEGIDPFEDDEEEEQEEEEQLTVREQIRENRDTFRVTSGELEVPAGKPTKRVEYREIYDFELRLGLPSGALAEIDGFGAGDQLQGGVGFINEIRGIGTRVPASTFPRTGAYVKYYLQNFGPDYVLSIYNNLVVYSGFVSSFYNMTLKPGKYDSFREYIYRLKEIGERGGPVLIEPLSQQEAASRGLETVPDHPTIEGEKAPFLESRMYYDVVEENIDHEAWDDPVEYLYEVLGGEDEG